MHVLSGEGGTQTIGAEDVHFGPEFLGDESSTYTFLMVTRSQEIAVHTILE